MINLYNTHIETLAIHRVGNMSRNEPLFLSEDRLRFRAESAQNRFLSKCFEGLETEEVFPYSNYHL